MSDLDMSPEDQAQVDQAVAQTQSANDVGTAQKFEETITGLDAKTRASIGGWLMELPRNADLGLLNLAVNTADSIKHFGLSVADKIKGVANDATGAATYVRNAASSAQLAGKAPGAQAEPASAVPPAPPPPTALSPHPHDNVYDVVRQKVLGFRDSMAEDQQLAGRGGPIDQVTQSLIQLGVPFTGYAKLLGGLRGAGALESIFNTAIAGGATDVTAMDAHAEQTGRAADLLVLGRHVEGKIGAALMTIAPDGSALNGLINYLADRNESIAEGHWKNVLDGLLLNAATTGLLHAASGTLKGGYAVAKYAAANAGELGPVGLKAQKGMVAFHGTSADFAPTASNPLGEFDMSKIGTGEGAQVRGHGLYFAQAAETADTYRKMLTRRNIPTGSALDHAYAAVNVMNGDTVAAYKGLQAKATAAADPHIRDVMSRAADLVKGGNVKKVGALYHVNIPDQAVGKMLNQDAFMSAQPKILAKIPQEDKTQLVRMLHDYDQHPVLEDYNGNEFRQLIERGIDEGYIGHPPKNKVGGNSAEDASDYMNQHGIPGSTYLDQQSRDSGKGTRNIVLFDPKHATIIKKE